MSASNKRHKAFHHSNDWFLGSLTNDLIYLILRHLDLPSVQRMCFVCKSWDWNAWKYVTHFDSRLEPSEEQWRVGWTSRLPYNVASSLLARLDAARVKTLYFTVKDDDVITELPTAMMQLTRVVGLTILNDLNEDLFGDVCTTFTQLTSLHAEATEKFGSYQLRHLTKLQSLWISPAQSDLEWVSCFHALKAISLRSWPYKNFSSLAQLPNLISFSVENSMYDEHLTQLATLTQIHELNLASCTYHSSLTVLTNLTALGVNDMKAGGTLPTRVTSLFVRYLSGYTDLQQLRALYCQSEIEDSEIVNLASLPNLRSLTLPAPSLQGISLLTNVTCLGLNEADWLSDPNTVQEFSALTNLQVLEFDGGPRITSDQIARVFPLKHVVIRYRPVVNQ